jgi:HK97 family phage portal protein
MAKFQTLGLSPPEKRDYGYAGPISPLNGPAPWEIITGGGLRSAADEVVTPITAMQTATVASCVRLLSESIAALPFVLYKKTDKGRTEAFDNPLHRIVSLEPNPDCSAFTFWSSYVGAIALNGNGYAEITRTNGLITGLWFLHPVLTYAFRKPDGSVWYRTTDGMTAGQFRELPAKDVLHTPWFSLNGITGISVIEQARNTVGTHLAMDKTTGRFYGNFATPQVALITKQTMKPETKTKVRADWEALQQGANQHRVAILDQEMDIKVLSMPASDAQWIESRKMSREELAGLFRLKPSQIGSESRVAGETYAAEQLSFLTDTLNPWLQRIQQEVTRKLLPGMSQYMVHHDVRSRLRLDVESQMKTFATARQWGILTANEARAEMHLDPGGPECDLFWAPVNETDAKRLLNPPKPTQVTEEVNA